MVSAIAAPSSGNQSPGASARKFAATARRRGMPPALPRGREWMPVYARASRCPFSKRPAMWRHALPPPGGSLRGPLVWMVWRSALSVVWSQTDESSAARWAAIVRALIIIAGKLYRAGSFCLLDQAPKEAYHSKERGKTAQGVNTGCYMSSAHTLRLRPRSETLTRAGV